MAQNRVGGIIELKIDGSIQSAKGNFTYNLGRVKRDAVIGADAVHGYKEVPQVAFIEGEITDRQNLNLESLVNTTDATVYLRLANGKIVVLRNSWFAAEGTGNTEEGNIGVRFEGMSGEEVS
ncbi:MAG TPA: phage tail tube protein [Pseudoxanthomonas sp.]